MIAWLVQWLGYGLHNRHKAVQFPVASKRSLLIQSVQNSFLFKRSLGSFSEIKAVWTWKWPVASTRCRYSEYVQRNLTLPTPPRTHSWRVQRKQTLPVYMERQINQIRQNKYILKIYILTKGSSGWTKERGKKSKEEKFRKNFVTHILH